MRVQFAIASVLILSILAQTGATVSAQSTQGEIEIECDTSAVIDVTPGASEPGIAMCEVTNPSDQQETVEISILCEDCQAGAISVVSSLDEITLGSGETVHFNVTLSSPEGALEGSFILRAYAEVTHIEGSECNDCSDSTWSFLGIILQYTDFDFIPEEDTLIMSPGEEKTLLVNITNHGNALSRFFVAFEEGGPFTISRGPPSIEIPYHDSEIVTYIITPQESACADGLEYYEELRNFSATSENGPEVTEESQVTLRVDCFPDEENGSLPAPTIVYSILALFVAALRGSRSNI